MACIRSPRGPPCICGPRATQTSCLQAPLQAVPRMHRVQCKRGATFASPHPPGARRGSETSRQGVWRHPRTGASRGQGPWAPQQDTQHVEGGGEGITAEQGAGGCQGEGEEGPPLLRRTFLFLTSPSAALLATSLPCALGPLPAVADTLDSSSPETSLSPTLPASPPPPQPAPLPAGTPEPSPAPGREESERGKRGREEDEKGTRDFRRFLTPGGVRVEEVVVGSGDVQAQPGDLITFHYVCRRSNGYFVASTVDPFGKLTDPVKLTLGPGGQMIEGLNEVIYGMRAGGKRRASIPPELGYVSEDLQPLPQEFDRRRALFAHSREPLLFEVLILGVRRPS